MTDYQWEIEERAEQREIYRPRVNETPYSKDDVQRWWKRKGVVRICKNFINVHINKHN